MCGEMDCRLKLEAMNFEHHRKNRNMDRAAWIKEKDEYPL